jgi:hypothetical protein
MPTITKAKKKPMPTTTPYPTPTGKMVAVELDILKGAGEKRLGRNNRTKE